MKYFETLLLRIFDSKLYNICKFKSLVRYSRIQSLAIKLIIETDSWFTWIRVIIIPENFGLGEQVVGRSLKLLMAFT